jgi:D-alanine-D-alanine ligase-like ATP-grasp enzyme
MSIKDVTDLEVYQLSLGLLEPLYRLTNQLPVLHRKIKYQINEAVKAAKVLSMQVAGVDVLITKDDLKTMLIEVNSNPGFTYDTGISPEIFQLSKYLEKETLE